MSDSKRYMESQEMMRQAMAEAMGIYLQKETNPKYGDTWRDIKLWNLIQHLKHELGEIETSGDIAKQYHNALDAVNLAAMIAVRCRDIARDMKP